MTITDSHRKIPMAQIDDRYAALRLIQAKAIERVRRHLAHCAIVAPLLCNDLQQEKLVLIDGFKRLHVLREQHAKQVMVLVVRLSESAAQAAIVTETRARQGLCAMAEAWIIRSLVLQCVLGQKDVGALLRQHISWVSQRLSLAERLDPSVQEDIRLGLVHATSAREVAQLPRGKQAQVALAICQNGLPTRQVVVLVQVLLACDEHQMIAVLRDPLRYVEPQPRRSHHRPGDGAAKRDGLGYWLMQLLRVCQRVDVLLASFRPEVMDNAKAAMLSQQEGDALLAPIGGLATLKGSKPALDSVPFAPRVYQRGRFSPSKYRDP
jgi:ParB-like chromosome segregation protein Spo0J